MLIRKNLSFEIGSGCCTHLRTNYIVFQPSSFCMDDPVGQWNMTMADGQLCKTWSLCVCGDLDNLLVVLIGEVRKSTLFPTYMFALSLVVFSK